MSDPGGIDIEPMGGLEVRVRTRRGAIEIDAAFGAAAGETTVLAGPNGAGKSTLVAIIAGLVRPDDGRVVLGGTVLEDTARGIHVPPGARSVGVLFQDTLLWPHLTAVENVAFPLRARGMVTSEAIARAMRQLEALGAAHRAAARPPTLSGGEAQRVALARALVAGPRLLLLDEPLSALDIQARGRIRALLGDVLAAFGGPSIVVTHDPDDVLALADRVVVIENGTVTQQGTVADLRRAPGSGYVGEMVGGAR